MMPAVLPFPNGSYRHEGGKRPMRFQWPAMAVLLMAGAALTGCATGGGSGSFGGEEGTNEVKLFVQNLAFMDATIYSITNGGRRRLGQVTGKRDMVFTFPLTFPSEMYLEIDILAGPRCETERITVDPGDHLELIIQNENAGWRCFGR